ncbi:hypothetical protein BV898_18713 [Hypsibius exemplaris]|uniref:Uncharacterized protein n=1 Tax=Hypsibius exemplaris TaxID=2072580 RepID=A0A9X6RNR1_HYPEX|nr:hypothetical protein BV898_18713 [Hypsibius exemplaris]
MTRFRREGVLTDVPLPSARSHRRPLPCLLRPSWVPGPLRWVGIDDSAVSDIGRSPLTPRRKFGSELIFPPRLHYSPVPSSRTTLAGTTASHDLTRSEVCCPEAKRVLLITLQCTSALNT